MSIQKGLNSCNVLLQNEFQNVLTVFCFVKKFLFPTPVSSSNMFPSFLNFVSEILVSCYSSPSKLFSLIFYSFFAFISGCVEPPRLSIVCTFFHPPSCSSVCLALFLNGLFQYRSDYMNLVPKIEVSMWTHFRWTFTAQHSAFQDSFLYISIHDCCLTCLFLMTLYELH